VSIIIVTGACGFIGSNLVRSLNRLGLEELLLVDDKTKIDSRQNLEGCKFIKCLDKKVFIELIKRRTLNMPVSTIFHQGACTDTTEQNVNYMMHDNYVYSKEILDWALMSNINLIYASSASIYGLSSSFEEVAENEKPNNLYSFSNQSLMTWYALGSRDVNLRLSGFGTSMFMVHMKVSREKWPL